MFRGASRWLTGLAAGLLVVGGAALVGVSPAAAAGPSITYGTTTQPVVLVGAASQAAANLTFTLPNVFTSASTFTLAVTPNGATTNN
ncbi:MAG: hypothetical protein ACRDVP_02670, partial [Acidimicrobiales bacterium]